MPTSKTRVLLWPYGVFFVPIVTGLWIFFAPHPSFIESANYREFREAHPESIEHLPDSATDIRMAISSRGLGGRAILYRFDAPADDCAEFGELMIASNGLSATARESFKWPVRSVITNHPAPIDLANLRVGLGRIEWFDIQSVSNGFSGFGPPFGLSKLWIDTKRGRVYYYWTD